MQGILTVLRAKFFGLKPPVQGHAWDMLWAGAVCDRSNWGCCGLSSSTKLMLEFSPHREIFRGGAGVLER